MSRTCRGDIHDMLATDTNVCCLGGVAGKHKYRHCQPSHSDLHPIAGRHHRDCAVSGVTAALLPLLLLGSLTMSLMVACSSSISSAILSSAIPSSQNALKSKLIVDCFFCRWHHLLRAGGGMTYLSSSSSSSSTVLTTTTLFAGLLRA